MCDSDWAYYVLWWPCKLSLVGEITCDINTRLNNHCSTIRKLCVWFTYFEAFHRAGTLGTWSTVAWGAKPGGQQIDFVEKTLEWIYKLDSLKLKDLNVEFRVAQGMPSWVLPSILDILPTLVINIWSDFGLTNYFYFFFFKNTKSKCIVHLVKENVIIFSILLCYNIFMYIILNVISCSPIILFFGPFDILFMQMEYFPRFPISAHPLYIWEWYSVIGDHTGGLHSPI